ncbi:hypothetical protein QB607_003812 [Clostridium botulinum]|nr:hypothetical protein [Clostridium botulinum]EKS4396688.1 hypothetical protein [Clostridium botulinum]
MSKETEHLKLFKYDKETDDFNTTTFNIEKALNDNWDKIDVGLADITTYDRKTYAELKALKDNNNLIEGKKYLLTDYKTKYKQPTTNVIKEMAVEELILTASSNNTFESIVYSALYPQDTIWYDFNNNICEDNTTPRNGFILRRYDPINKNDSANDFRNILWARWAPDNNQYYNGNTLTNYSTWTSGNAILNVIYKSGNKLLIAYNTNVPNNSEDTNVFNVIYDDITIGLLYLDKRKILNYSNDTLYLKLGELKEYKTFGSDSTDNIIIGSSSILHDNVILGKSVGNYIGVSYHNTINNSGRNNILNSSNVNILAASCFYNIIDNNCDNNFFTSNCNDNKLKNNCDSNLFCNSCNGNVLGVDCSVNLFGYNCDNNSFGNNCNNNIFLDSCTNNSFGNNCSSNSFGNYCVGNNFGNYFISNSFENNCDYNYFGNDCINNKFKEYCNFNTFFNNCGYITFNRALAKVIVKGLYGKDLTNLNIYAKSYSITFERKEDGTYVYWYLDSSNRPVYTQIP